MSARPAFPRRCAAALLFVLVAPFAAAGFLDKPEDDGILPVEEAFRLQPALWQKDHLVLGWDVAPGCYLYRDKLTLEVLEPSGAASGELLLPAGTTQRDEHFGEVQVLRGAVQAQWRPSKNSSPPKRIRLRWQGCAEGKVCYQPQARELTVVDLTPRK